MAKMGRPTVFSDEIKDRVKLFARKGFTDKEIAQGIGITKETLNNWKKKYPDFFTSINEWKALPNAEVERSLFERACGYSHPEDKVFCNNGEIIVQPTIKHYPPDPTAIIFWLKNRRPDKWRDKQDVEHSGDVVVEIVKYSEDQ
jgi:transcriptional regulator with XRE-family HTH domain